MAIICVVRMSSGVLLCVKTVIDFWFETKETSNVVPSYICYKILHDQMS